jgi:hypothetical protein
LTLALINLRTGRYGGLRCPSEVLRLKWRDVDFEKDRFTVHASKTEHHSDGGIRTVPMFLELKPLFQTAFDEAPTGTVYCITRYRDKTVNLRAQMHKITKWAGLEIWPKTFQNLRSSRETELFKMTGGNVKAVCSWIGNSPVVAMQHYAQVTEADYEEAAKIAILEGAEKTVHNPVQNPVESSSIELQEGKIEDDVIPCFCKTIQQKDNGVQFCANSTPQWAQLDSNQRPMDYESTALTAELRARNYIQRAGTITAFLAQNK